MLFRQPLFCKRHIFFYLAAGQLVPCEEENPDIGMASEEINIVLERTYYQVAVDFVFFNPSESVSFDIGFPFFRGRNSRRW